MFGFSMEEIQWPVDIVYRSLTYMTNKSVSEPHSTFPFVTHNLLKEGSAVPLLTITGNDIKCFTVQVTKRAIVRRTVGVVEDEFSSKEALNMLEIICM